MSMVATSQEQAASTLGVHQRTFAAWLAKGCPGEPRSYRIVECIKWARENAWSEEAVLIESATGEATDLRTQYLEAKIAKTRGDTELAELKIATQNEQLVDIQEVQTALNRQASMMREGLERLERTDTLTGREAADVVVELLDELDGFDLRSEII